MQHIENISRHLEKLIRPRGISFLSLVGLLYLAKKTFGALSSLASLLSFPHDLAKRYGEGSWVLITGGAQGIGATFADQFAIRGFHLILVDFNEKALEETATSLRAKYPQTKIKTIVKDFTNSLQEGFYDSIVAEIEDRDVSVLINNVGCGIPAGLLPQADEASILRMMTVNMYPTAMMSRRLAQTMLKRNKKSAIINVSSVLGLFPATFFAPYSASKAFVDYFSQAIQQEFGDRIDVLTVRPGYVSTAIIKFAQVGGFIISPEDFVKPVLRQLGRSTITSGHWRHCIQKSMSDFPYLRGFAFRNYETRMRKQLKGTY